jgi:hypothetical protein
MNQREFASVAIAITGFAGIAYSFKLLQGITSGVLWMDTGERLINLFVIAAILVPYFLLLGFGFVLVARRNRIAELWFPEATPVQDSVSAVQLRAVGYSLTGVLLIGLAIPEITQIVGSILLIVFPSQEERTLFESQKVEFIRYVRSSWSFALGTLVQAGVGIYLMHLGKRTDAAPRTEEAKTDAPVSIYTCPHCDHPYRPADYNWSVETTFCSKCKGVLPRPEA